MIELDITLSLPSFVLETTIDLPGQGVTALFGSSGSGKSTLLRCIAGLRKPQRGRLVVNGEVWQDDTTFIPPHQRPVGMVFQDAALFPHLNVQQNLDYGARRSKVKANGTGHLIETLGIGHLLQRRTNALSGGEKQRVAIARALFCAPRMLLLDEPLAALDAQRKAELLPYLEILHRELDIPVIYVSHAPEEVARLADHIVQLDDGRIIDAGPALDIFPRLKLPYAQREGTFSLLAGHIESHDDYDHLTRVDIGGAFIWVRYLDKAVGSHVRLRMLARDISLSLKDEHHNSILNSLATEVVELEETEPGFMLVKLRLDQHTLLSRITTRSARTLDLHPGQRVYAQIKGVAPQV